ncbi:MAG: BON domain-containing protein [Elusimicrobiales bacterium]|nr:BON domain-containing protein [Elusimicrobiales bacterium]
MKKNIILRTLVLSTMAAAFAACATTGTPETAGEFIDDSVITTRVKSKLADDNFFKSFQIGVETRQGTVQLSGFVNSREAADKAGKLAEGVKGVRSLKNDLIVK